MNLDRPGLVWKKGAQVHCPNCDDHIADFARHIWQGDRFDQQMFRWRNQTFVFGEKFECKKCESEIFNFKEGNFMKIKEKI